MIAFIIAPLAPSAAVATLTLFDGVPNGGYLQWVVLFALIGGYPATLVLGLPAYFVLRSRLAPRFGHVALAGGLVAVAPWLLLMLFAPTPDLVVRGEHILAQDGVKTVWGWLDGLRLVGWIFLLGLFGGAAFWFAAVWRPPSRSAPAAP